MDELFLLLGLPVTPYAVCLGAVVLCGAALMVLRAEKGKRDAALMLAVWSIPLGLIFARLFWLLARYDYAAEVGLEGCLRIYEGGYALWGAAIGIFLGCVINAGINRMKLSETTDLIAPSCALCIAVCRFAEYFTGEGIGPEVENEALWFFPVAVCNEWEEWNYAIFMLEGLTALVIFFIVLLRRFRRSGDKTRLLLIIYSASQVLFESLRRDNCLKWLFVRVSQLTAVTVLLGLIVAGLVRRGKMHPSGDGKRIRLIIDISAFFTLVGLCVALEFAYDKAAFLDNRIGYAIMLCCCTGLGIVTGDVSLRY